jgi:uncharacterized Tic20 family protein
MEQQTGETVEPVPGPGTPDNQEKETRTWAMILHLSLLSGLVLPVAGLIAPIIIYVVKKDSLPGIVPHGYVVFNWMISAVIYAILSLILMIVVIGFFTIFAVLILSIAFPIIGGIKASEGQVWPYPLSIPIFK